MERKDLHSPSANALKKEREGGSLISIELEKIEADYLDFVFFGCLSSESVLFHPHRLLRIKLQAVKCQDIPCTPTLKTHAGIMNLSNNKATFEMSLLLSVSEKKGKTMKMIAFHQFSNGNSYRLMITCVSL